MGVSQESESFVLNDGMSNIKRLRLAAENYLLTLIVAGIYAGFSLLFFNTVNILVFDILCVIYLFYMLRKLGCIDRMSRLTMRGNRFSCKGDWFSIGQVVSVVPVDQRGWYSIYRIVTRPPSNASSPSDVAPNLKFDVLDIFHKKSQSSLEKYFLDKLPAGVYRKSLIDRIIKKENNSQLENIPS
jgi:hypothetical protein